MTTLPTPAELDRLREQVLSGQAGDAGLRRAGVEVGRPHFSIPRDKLLPILDAASTAITLEAFLREHGKLLLGSLEHSADTALDDHASDLSCRAAHRELAALLSGSEVE